MSDRLGGDLISWVRLVWAGICFLVALLAVFQAPWYPLWLLAVGVTEWGHVFALAPLVIFWPGWTLTMIGRLSAVIGLAAVILFLTPLFRAAFLAPSVARGLNDHFPVIEQNKSAYREKPFSLWALFSRSRYRDCRLDTMEFAVPQGVHLSLDLYRPVKQEKLAPVVVVIHGGSWQAGSKADLADLNFYLAERHGYAVAAIEYRLAPKFPYPAALEDVKAAISYLKQNAQLLGLDQSHIALVGRSAGGHLALLSAYTSHDSAIKGVVGFYAPSDLIYAYENPSNPLVLDSKSVLEGFLGGSLANLPQVYQDASPVNFIGPKSPATLLFHGGRDELVWPIHGKKVVGRLADFNRPHFEVCLPWATHGFDYNIKGPGGQISTYAVERFLAFVFAL